MACLAASVSFAEEEGRATTPLTTKDKTVATTPEVQRGATSLTNGGTVAQVEDKVAQEDPSKADQPKVDRKQKPKKGWLKRMAVNTMALLAFIFGILALVTYYGAFLFGVLAIIFGIIGIGQTSPGETGRILAILGLVFGILGLILWPVVIFVVI